jgi:hypothetical protein
MFAVIMFAKLAVAQGYQNIYTNSYGNMSNTTVNGSGGYNANINTIDYGNMKISNGYDNRGNNVNCTTTRYGTMETTTCN